MAKSTPNPEIPQQAATHSDWFTLLTSAFINGLKSYGAALMVGAPCLPVLETWETKANSPKPKTHAPQITKPQHSPSLPLTKPAWRNA